MYFFKNFRSNDEFDSLCDSSQLDTEPEFSEDFLGSDEIQSRGTYSEIGNQMCIFPPNEIQMKSASIICLPL